MAKINDIQAIIMGLRAQTQAQAQTKKQEEAPAAEAEDAGEIAIDQDDEEPGEVRP